MKKGRRNMKKSGRKLKSITLGLENKMPAMLS